MHGVGSALPKAGFMGSYPVNGRLTFCIDLNGQGPSTASGYAGSVTTTIRKQLGWTKDHRGGDAGAVRGAALTAVELGRLAYLLDRYAATTSASTAVAVEHVVRTLTVGDRAQADREAVRWKEALRVRPAVRAAYDAISADVTAHAGPYAVGADWATPPSALADGVLTLSVRSQSGAGMPGVRLHATSTAGGPGQPAQPAQSWTAVTGAGGTATVTVPVTAKGALGIAVTAVGLPGPAPTLYTPKHYASATSPDRFAQRTVGPGPRVSLSTSVTATVDPATPTVTTAAGPATPTVGDALTDDVTVAGAARGYRGTATATLWGPFAKAPTAKSCADPATPAGTATVDVMGDGTVTTAGIPTTSPGFYTWTVELGPGPMQDAVRTACGDKAETRFVTAAPVLALATAAPPRPGQPATATVTVSGMYPGYTPKAALTLHGPFASPPAATDCRSTTKALTSTVALTGDGDYPTRSFTIPFSGYYTWVAAVPGNATQPPLAVACGAAASTFLVARDDLPALVLTQTATTGSTAPGSTAAAKGARLTVAGPPGARVAAPLVSAPGLLGGIDVPANVALAAEFDQGAHVGDLLGTIVVAGRPTDANATPGAMADLARVAVGATVTLVDVNGRTGKFVVDSATTLPRTQSIPATLLAQGNPLTLLILSTTDPVPYGAGLTTYRTHVILTATPV